MVHLPDTNLARTLLKDPQPVNLWSAQLRILDLIAIGEVETAEFLIAALKCGGDRLGFLAPHMRRAAVQLTARLDATMRTIARDLAEAVS